jgi:hypothetical protein
MENQEDITKKNVFDDAVKKVVAPQPVKIEIVLNGKNLVYPKQQKSIGRVTKETVAECVGINIANYDKVIIRRKEFGDVWVAAIILDKTTEKSRRFSFHNISQASPVEFGWDLTSAPNRRQLLFLIDDTKIGSKEIIFEIELTSLPGESNLPFEVF